MPASWVKEQNVMDDVWKPLSMRGVNYYAYGRPKPPHMFAARSDPESPLYQAWAGVYVIADSDAADGATPMRLAELDQLSWLGAMGDPRPAFKLTGTRERGTIAIAGADRRLYAFDATTHSDLGPATTPLAKHVGMPPATQWPPGLAAYHEISLRGYYASWYDAKRSATVIVYTCAAAYDHSGSRRDNFPTLDADFKQMMRNVHVQDRLLRAAHP